MKINETGRSMIEMLGVLAIIGILSVGGIAGYSKAMAKFRVNKTITQIQHIATNTRILFASHRTYKDLSTTVIDNAKLIPDDMKDGSNYVNAFGGNITLAKADRFAASDDKAFLITYPSIPQEACIDLAAQDWDASSGSGLVVMGINDDTVATDYYPCTTNAGSTGKGKVCGGVGAMKVSVAAAACNSGTGNTMYFKYF